MSKIRAFLDGGSSDPEVVITVSESDLDERLTFVQIDRPGWGTLAELLLDRTQVEQLVVELQSRLPVH